MKSLLIEDMNWVDVEYLIKNGYRNAIVGCAAIEQHGPHLPLKTDVLLADVLTVKVAVKLGNTLIAPTIKFGCSEQHLDFPGTIALGKMTYQEIILDYIFSLTKSGFENIIFLPTQKTNHVILLEIINHFMGKMKFAKVFLTVSYDDIRNKQLKISDSEKISESEAGIHGGEIETSMMINIAPSLVKTNRFKSGFIGQMDEEEEYEIKRRGIKAFDETGIIGDPSKSSSRRGELYLNSAVNTIINDLLKYLE